MTEAAANGLIFHVVARTEEVQFRSNQRNNVSNM
jgi:hypothetical protein